MGFASYAVIAAGTGWTILHDGNAEGDYATGCVRVRSCCSVTGHPRGARSAFERSGTGGG
jgi:hypothetical protein